MKIIIFTIGNPANIGGVQLSTARLTDDLVKHGHEVVLFSHFNVPMQDWAYPVNSASHSVYYEQKDTPKNRALIYDSVSAHNPDIVIIINSSQTAGVVVSALQPMNIPLILSERGAPETILKYNWACRTQRDMIHLMCDASHLLMPSYQALFPDFLKKQSYIIPSAVPYPDQKNIPDFDDRKKHILWVGRMTFEKDVNLLITAFDLISDQIKDWTLHLVGDGALKEQLMEQVNNTALKNRIIFHGSLFNSDLENAYKTASVFVLPSRSEGCPLALREAMGWGLPAIGYKDCPGTNEIIKDRENGHLVDGQLNRSQALADSLLSLCTDRQVQVQYGHQAREDTKIYNLDNVHEKWRAMIETVAKKQPLIHVKKHDKPYYKRLMKMVSRVKKIGSTRNWIASQKKPPLSLFLNQSIRTQYMNLYGLPIFDFKNYFHQNPNAKRLGHDPLLDFITQADANYIQQDLLPILGDTPSNAEKLINFWTKGDFSALPEKQRHLWETHYKKDMNLGVLEPISLWRFIVFYHRACCWGRNTVWDSYQSELKAA